MPKRALSEPALDGLIPEKRLHMASPSFTPIKVASKENADSADADTPFRRLLTAMKDPFDKPLKGDCIVYWMRLSDLRSTAFMVSYYFFN